MRKIVIFLFCFIVSVGFAKAPEEMAGAWMLVRNSIAEGTQFAKDPKTLEKLAEMMQTNSAFRQKLGSGWEQELKDIVATASKNPCNTCGTPAGISIGRTPMDVYLDNVDYFIKNIDVNSKGKGFYNWMRGKTLGIGEPLETQLDELHHTLEVIKREGITNDNLVDLGKQFPNGTKKYDIRKTGGEYIELKNKVYTNTGISTDDADQLINGYLKNISKMEDLTWELKLAKNKSVWNTAKEAEDAMKMKWKTVFTNKKTEIFNANPELWKQFDRIGGGKIEDIEDFIELLNHQSFNTNHPIFNFIKAQ